MHRNRMERAGYPAAGRKLFSHTAWHNLSFYGKLAQRGTSEPQFAEAASLSLESAQSEAGNDDWPV